MVDERQKVKSYENRTCIGNQKYYKKKKDEKEHRADLDRQQELLRKAKEM